MADTATLPPEQADNAPPPETTPTTPAGGIGDVAAEIGTKYREAEAARRREGAGLRASAAAQAPKIQDAQAAFAEFQKDVTADLPVSKPSEPPPPRTLSGFMSAREGESPEASVSKFVAAFGLFAGSLGGLAKGDARGSLAALTGALTGWREGDADRADRAFKDWQARTDAALKQADAEWKSYDRWFAAKNMSLDSMLKGLQLDAMQHNNEQAMLAFDSGSIEHSLGFLQKYQTEQNKAAEAKAVLELHRAEQMKADGYKEAVQAESVRHHRAIEEQKERELTSAVTAATPEVIDKLAEARMRGESFPPNMMRGKSGQALALKVDARVVELAKERGIDPSMLSGIKSDLDAKRASLKKLETTTVMSEAQASRFETHLDAMVQLSEKMDNSGIPVWERMRRKAKGQYGGDPQVAALEFQGMEVAMEYAKFVVGTAQGDQQTREEARKIFNAWMAHPQLVSVAELAKQNAHNNIENNRAAARELTHYIDTIGGLVDKPAPKPAAITMPNDPKKGERARITITNPQTGERGRVYADSPWQQQYAGWQVEEKSGGR
jgi:hypothetical protein